MKYAHYTVRDQCVHGVQLSARLIFEAITWCTPENGRGLFYVRPNGLFLFDDADTALAFKIRWAGAIPDDA